jgi:hypothetical protein
MYFNIYILFTLQIHALHFIMSNDPKLNLIFRLQVTVLGLVLNMYGGLSEVVSPDYPPWNFERYRLLGHILDKFDRAKSLYVGLSTWVSRTVRRYWLKSTQNGFLPGRPLKIQRRTVRASGADCPPVCSMHGTQLAGPISFSFLSLFTYLTPFASYISLSLSLTPLHQMPPLFDLLVGVVPGRSEHIPGHSAYFHKSSLCLLGFRVQRWLGFDVVI